jgi:hypothetical protein
MNSTHIFKIRKVYFKEHVLYVHFAVKLKVEQSLYRPGQRVPGDKRLSDAKTRGT